MSGRRFIALGESVAAPAIGGRDASWHQDVCLEAFDHMQVSQVVAGTHHAVRKTSTTQVSEADTRAPTAAATASISVPHTTGGDGAPAAVVAATAPARTAATRPTRRPAHGAYKLSRPTVEGIHDGT
jgi:hypothetical protein